MNPKHDSIRGWFAAALHEEMEKDERIWCLTGDLGYGMLDQIRDDFPKRFVNVGASEQLLVGAGVGLAASGKIPICYSITTFLLFRPFEWIRNYLQHEQIPVKLVGSGLNDDYKHDGFTHQPNEDKEVRTLFYPDGVFLDIDLYIPTKKESIPNMVHTMIRRRGPTFMCLRR